MAGPRQPLAVLLALAAVALGLVGGVALHLRAQALDRAAFADNALAALDRAPVRAVVTDEIADRLLAVAPGLPRGEVERVVDRIVGTRAFRREFRRSAAQANRVLFDGDGDTAALRLEAVTAALAGIDPRLAQLLPASPSTRLLTIRRGSLGISTVRLADWVETAARWAPPLAVVALLGALALAADRRALLRATGLLAALAGGLLLAAALLGRATARTQVESSDAVSPAAARDAAGAVWDVYLGDLRVAAIVTIGAGLAVAAAATLLGGGRRG